MFTLQRCAVAFFLELKSIADDNEHDIQYKKTI